MIIRLEASLSKALKRDLLYLEVKVTESKKITI
jgi:hypothetical protein